MEVGLLSLGGAYKTPNWEATAKLGMHSWNLSYLQKVPNVKVRSIVMTSLHVCLEQLLVYSYK